MIMHKVWFRSKLTFTGFLLFCFVFVFQGQAQPVAPLAATASEWLESEFRKGKFPGLAVAVWHNGAFILKMGLGYADRERREEIDPERSLFRIGSISKSLTASGLALLQEERRINLDVPVQEYVPDFPEKRWPVTLRQLGGHLAGIRHYRGMEFLSNVHYPTVSEGLVIFSADTLLFEPGTQYSYSSYGWNLISAAMENASDEEFLNYMETAVFGPLGMEHTLPDISYAEPEGRVSFYTPESDTFMLAPQVDNSYKWAGGGFLSTATDIARFGAAHLEPGFLSAGSLWEYTHTQYTSAGDATRYGIGWRTTVDPAGRPYFGHSGGSVGGTSILLIYPQYDLVITAMSNSGDVPVGALGLALASLLIQDLSR